MRSNPPLKLLLRCCRLFLALDLYLLWHVTATNPKIFSPVTDNLPMLPANRHISRISSVEAANGLVCVALATVGLRGLVAYCMG